MQLVLHKNKCDRIWRFIIIAATDMGGPSQNPKNKMFHNDARQKLNKYYVVWYST